MAFSENRFGPPPHEKMYPGPAALWQRGRDFPLSLYKAMRRPGPLLRPPLFPVACGEIHQIFQGLPRQEGAQVPGADIRYSLHGLRQMVASSFSRCLEFSSMSISTFFILVLPLLYGGIPALFIL